MYFGEKVHNCATVFHCANDIVLMLNLGHCAILLENGDAFELVWCSL